MSIPKPRDDELCAHAIVKHTLPVESRLGFAQAACEAELSDHITFLVLDHDLRVGFVQLV